VHFGSLRNEKNGIFAPQFSAPPQASIAACPTQGSCSCPTMAGRECGILYDDLFSWHNGFSISAAKIRKKTTKSIFH
jgi:hypothetical protein